MKMKRWIGAFASGVLLSLALTAATHAAPGVVIDDQADLLSYSQEEDLQTYADQLAQERNLELMILTTDDTDGMSARVYAETFYDRHYTQEDAVIYLIDMDNREYLMTFTGEAMRYLTDERVERIYDDAQSEMAEQDYAGAFAVMLDGTSGAYRDGVVAGHTYTNEDTGEVIPDEEPKSKSPLSVILGALAGLLTGGGFFRSTKAKYEMKTGGYEYDWRSHHKADIKAVEDRMVNQFVTQRQIPREPPRTPGGGSGHGSNTTTIHTGVGGHTFGGGSGRKF